MHAGCHGRRIDPRDACEEIHRPGSDALSDGFLRLLRHAEVSARGALAAAAAGASAVSLHLEDLFAARCALLVRVVNVESCRVLGQDRGLLLL